MSPDGASGLSVLSVMQPNCQGCVSKQGRNPHPPPALPLASGAPRMRHSVLLGLGVLIHKVGGTRSLPHGDTLEPMRKEQVTSRTCQGVPSPLGCPPQHPEPTGTSPLPTEHSHPVLSEKGPRRGPWVPQPISGPANWKVGPETPCPATPTGRTFTPSGQPNTDSAPARGGPAVSSHSGSPLRTSQHLPGEQGPVMRTGASRPERQARGGAQQRSGSCNTSNAAGKSPKAS